MKRFYFYYIKKLSQKDLDGTSLRKFLRTGADKDHTKKNIDVHIESKESKKNMLYHKINFVDTVLYMITKCEHIF